MPVSLYARPDLYDAVHAGPAKGELAFVLRQAERVGRRVLELACGTGRLTIPLARAGLQVTGIDLSPAMLSRAVERAQGAPIDWVAADMRSFSLAAEFDLVLIPINSLCHLETNADVRACLATVHRHLAPTGRLVIDVFNPSLEILARDSGRWYDLGTFSSEDGPTVRLSERNRYDRATQLNAILWKFEFESGAAIDVSLRMRQFFPQELDTLLEANGYEVLAKYGGYGEKPFHSDARQQLVIARPA